MGETVLSKVELEIMEGVWRKGSAVTVRDILESVYGDGEKAYTTVQTIMNILVDKGVLSREKVGMVNFYTAVLTRNTAIGSETQSLVRRLFEGSFGQLATYLVESGELTPAETERLRAAIDAQKGEGGADA